MGLSSGDDLYVHLHADGYAEDLSCNGEANSNSIDVAKHYYTHWSNTLNKGWPHDGWYGPGGRFSNCVTPDPVTLPTTDGIATNLGFASSKSRQAAHKIGTLPGKTTRYDQD